MEIYPMHNIPKSKCHNKAAAKPFDQLKQAGQDSPETTYIYHDEDGKPLFRVVRRPGKKFHQERCLGEAWMPGVAGVRRVLYRLPQLLKADPAVPVFLCEGEKDADRLAALDLVATTNPMGALNWRPDYSKALKGRRVVILEDNDAAGRARTATLLKELRPYVLSATVLSFPELPEHGDISDWLDKGHTVEDLTDLLKAEPPAFDSEHGEAYDGPAAKPAAESNQTPAWSPPQPLSEAPPANPFPLAVLPLPLRQVVSQAAAAVHCPTDYVAVPLLTLAGAAIGRSRILRVKNGHFELPALYTGVVGPTGLGKTPALTAARRPFDAVQAQRVKDFKAQTEQPRKPLENAYVSDITTEKLASCLQDAPRGLALIRDELCALLNSFNQYKHGGKGADQQFFLSAWSANPIDVQRRKDPEPLHIESPFLAITGGIQPDLLHLLRGHRHIRDGFFERFLITYPTPPPAAGDDGVELHPDTEKLWANIVAKLYTLTMDDADQLGPRPKLVNLTADAKLTWRAFTQQLADERNAEDFPRCLDGIWAKLSTYGARLALILHYLRWACDQANDDAVDATSMVLAVQLVDYFKSHARKVSVAIDADPNVDGARRILRWLQKHPEFNDFNRSRVYEDLRGYFSHDSRNLKPPLELLVTLGYLQRKDQDANRRGPKPDAYAVNPKWDRFTNP